MVLILLLISDSSSLFANPLETVPSTQITIGITVTFMFRMKVLVIPIVIDKLIIIIINTSIVIFWL